MKKNALPVGKTRKHFGDTLDKDNLAKKVSTPKNITTQDKLDILINEESMTRKVLALVNSNLAEIIAILKDQKRSETEKGKGY